MLPALPGFTQAGDLLVVEPIDWCLRGICFDGSPFSRTGFSVLMFAMPLCIPTETVDFCWGHRLVMRDGTERWDDTLPNLLQELTHAITTSAVPYLSAIGDSGNFITNAIDKCTNWRGLEALAYALARAGRNDEAIAMFEWLLEQPVRFAWQHGVLKRAAILRSLLLRRPLQALRQMQLWEATTIANLGLRRIKRAS